MITLLLFPGHCRQNNELWVAQYKLWTMWDEPSATNLKLHYGGSAGNELCPASISPTRVPRSARKHTDHYLEPYSANDVQSSLSPACSSRGALLCKPLCVSNKTQGGPTQVNLRSAHLCFTPPRPDCHLFSSAPLWSDTFGWGGADEIPAAYSQIIVEAWCAFDSYRAYQANRSRSNDLWLRLTKLLPKFAETLQRTNSSVRKVKSTLNMAAGNPPTVTK